MVYMMNGMLHRAVGMAAVKDSLIIRQLFDRVSCTYTYLLVDSSNVDREAVIIDPVAEHVDRDLEAVEGLRASLKYVLNTHVHADHVTGSGKLKTRLSKLRSVISEFSRAKADVTVGAGDYIAFGNRKLSVRYTPGHTIGCVTYVMDDESCAFVGDAVMIRGCGRTDFQDGCPVLLYESVWSQIFTLPDPTRLYPAHDYSGRLWTTVEEEKLHNPRLTKTKEDFVALMRQRFDGTNYPVHMDASVPANMVCGVFHTDQVPNVGSIAQ